MPEKRLFEFGKETFENDVLVLMLIVLWISTPYFEQWLHSRFYRSLR